MTFKVGDRVMVYGWVQMFNQPYLPRCGGKATVKWVHGSACQMHVEFDKNPSTGQEDDGHYQADVKRCRRLIKRERRRVWIQEKFVRLALDPACQAYPSALIRDNQGVADESGHWIEFIEVPRKK